MDEFVYLWAQWGMLDRHEHYQKAKEVYGDLKQAWQNVTPEFFAQLGIGQEKIKRNFEIRPLIDFQDITRTMGRLSVRLLCIDEPDYPEPLKQIPTAPPFLFIRGQLPPLHKTIAIVGTRKMTNYGRVVTERFTADLVRNGFVIISGLATGVDQHAHETTLEYHGATVAVLGSGVDNVTPPCNNNLAEQIIRQGGAVISEFPFGAPPFRSHFPQRNRIIAGLSQGVLVTEGGRKSGALITADFAKEFGRDVFSIPSAILSGELSGTNYLIQQGAKLVQNAEDILESYHMKGMDFRQFAELNADEQIILGHVKQSGKTMDELAMSTTYNISRLSELLVNLCLKGQVQEIGQKWVLL